MDDVGQSQDSIHTTPIQRDGWQVHTLSENGNVSIIPNGGLQDDCDELGRDSLDRTGPSSVVPNYGPLGHELQTSAGALSVPPSLSPNQNVPSQPLANNSDSSGWVDNCSAEGSRPKRLRSANWALEEEALLVKLFRDLERSYDSRKALWEALALQLAEKGYDRKPVSLEQKWGNLLQTYRSVKDYNKNRQEGSPSFYQLNVGDRKKLYYTWRVNSMEEKVFYEMEFLKDRDSSRYSCERTQAPSNSHGVPEGIAQHANPPGTHLHANPVGDFPAPTLPVEPSTKKRHIPLDDTQLTKQTLNSVARTVLSKVGDAERLLLLTPVQDLDHCKGYVGFISDCLITLQRVKQAMQG